MTCHRCSSVETASSMEIYDGDRLFAVELCAPCTLAHRGWLARKVSPAEQLLEVFDSSDFDLATAIHAFDCLCRECEPTVHDIEREVA